MTGTLTRVGIDPWLFLDEVVGDGYLNASQRRNQRPSVNVWSVEDSITVDVDLPGVAPEKVEVSVERNVLTLRGETAAAQFPESAQVYRKERFDGAFERSIELPFEVDVAQARASAKNGVIRITLPKSAEAKVKRIAVEQV